MIRGLFLDIGGVLLTNGWGHELRQATAQRFGYDYQEFESRHAMVNDIFERGRMSFDEYLHWTIFHSKRSFEISDVKSFILNAVRPFQEMIDMFKSLKGEYNLKVGVVSNEGREIGLDRIRRFDLPNFVDFFILSAFVHFRKPDHEIYRLAIDVAAIAPSEICYIDDRALLIEAGSSLGLQTIHHTDFSTTKEQLEKLLPASRRVKN